jgi:Mrp family chromosome partitioning ATPase/uncharacterized protein involved in exopolysaccharide biosynthesis
LLSALATWFLVGNLPPVFKAKTIIETGIISNKGVFSLQKDNPFIQKFQIESSFNGLTEKMKSRSVIKLLTDRLLLHDLQADNTQEKPFRVPDEEELGMTQAELNDLAMKLKTNLTDSMLNAKPVELTSNRLAEAFNYDYESLLKKLQIQRIGETDYLSIEFESESPELSYFAVNTFIKEFFNTYNKELSHSEDVALEFYEKQVRERKDSLNSKIEQINTYKKNNGLLDVSHQRETVVTHMKDLEMKREEVSQQIPALESQIRILNNQIQKYREVNLDAMAQSIYLSDDFKRIDDEIKKLSDQQVDYVATGRNTDAVQRRIEKLRMDQSALFARTIPVNSKTMDKIDNQVREWMQEWLQKQLDLELAKAAKNSYDIEIGKQLGRAGKLLNDDNQLATLASEKDRIEKEYLRATEEYDNAKLYAEGTENPLTVIEPAQIPEEPESKHRALFSIFAGVAGGTMTSIILFLLAFVDTSVQIPSQFQKITRLPLMGYVNRIRARKLNLHHLFHHQQSDKGLEFFKENIRKLRTAIENSGAKSFLFVSSKEQEGKSFLVVLLAYALSLNQKRVLIIDTNFKNNTLSGFKTKSFIEISTEPGSFNYIPGIGSGQKQLPPPPGSETGDVNLKNIDIVGNKGGNQSPAEVLAGKDFKKIIEQYGRKYDFIFLEAAAINKFSDARELIPFVEKVVAVVSAEEPFGASDKDTMEFLRSLDDKMLGGILNKVDLKNI